MDSCPSLSSFPPEQKNKTKAMGPRRPCWFSRVFFGEKSNGNTFLLFVFESRRVENKKHGSLVSSRKNQAAEEFSSPPVCGCFHFMFNSFSSPGLLCAISWSPVPRQSLECPSAEHFQRIPECPTPSEYPRRIPGVPYPRQFPGVPKSRGSPSIPGPLIPGVPNPKVPTGEVLPSPWYFIKIPEQNIRFVVQGDLRTKNKHSFVFFYNKPSKSKNIQNTASSAPLLVFCIWRRGGAMHPKP